MNLTNYETFAYFGSFDERLNTGLIYVNKKTSLKSEPLGLLASWANKSEASFLFSVVLQSSNLNTCPSVVLVKIIGSSRLCKPLEIVKLISILLVELLKNNFLKSATRKKVISSNVKV